LRRKGASKSRILKKQRVKRKKKSRAWAWAAKVLGSAFLRIAVLLSVIILLSAVFIYCYHFVLTSPYFSLNRIEITGAPMQEHQRIVKLCGLEKGQNLLALKLGEIRMALERDPWIRSARVERQLPNTLHISVVMEQPCAIVAAERLYYMNRWGEIFKEVGEGEPVDFPVVTGLSDLGSEAGEELKEVASLIRVLEKKRGLVSYTNLSEVHIEDPQYFSVYFKGIPAEIQMGPTNLELQLAKLRRIVRHLRSTGRINQASRIDLQYAGGAVVSFQSSTWQARRVNTGA